MEWDITKIGDVCQVGDGAHASIKRQNEGILYLTAKNFKEDGLDLSNLDYISLSDYNKHFPDKSNKLIRPQTNDLVFSIIGSIGTPYIVKKTDVFGLSSSVAILRPNRRLLDTRYLFYWMLSPALQTTLSMVKSGVAQGFLSLEIIKNLPVLLPPVSIQEKTATILSTYDDLIENNKRRIAILGKIAQEIYREWFVRFRYPGYKKGKTPKGVSIEWNNTVLKDIIHLTMGQSPKSEFYNQEGIGLPFHQGVGNFGDRFPAHNVYCSVKGRIAEKGSILFSVRAPVGRLNIADRKLIIGRGLAAMKHRKGLNTYLYYMLRHEFSKEDIIGNGAIFNSVGKDELANFRVLYNDSIAELFNGLIEPIDKKIELLNLSNFNLRHTRDLFLSRLLSGKLSVEDLDIQFPQSMEDDYAEFHQ